MSLKNSSLSLLFMFSFFLPNVNSLFFNISRFNKNSASLIEQQGDANINGGRIKLTENSKGTAKADSIGRTVYKKEVILWDEKSREVTDFTAHFSFVIQREDSYVPGDGLTFFLAKYTPTVPAGSGGGFLALYGPEANFSNSENSVVAVEFDTFKNVWDPSDNHVGIDVNSVVSVANVTFNGSLKDGRTANAWVTYSSSDQKLSVFLTYDEYPVYKGNSSLSYNVDLRDVLPSRVAVGFSASTGLAAETHEIISWSFTSNLEEKTEGALKPAEKMKNHEPKKKED